jgi:hypothetical protein
LTILQSFVRHNVTNNTCCNSYKNSNYYLRFVKVFVHGEVVQNYLKDSPKEYKVYIAQDEFYM